MTLRVCGFVSHYRPGFFFFCTLQVFVHMTQQLFVYVCFSLVMISSPCGKILLVH